MSFKISGRVTCRIMIGLAVILFAGCGNRKKAPEPVNTPTPMITEEPVVTREPLTKEAKALQTLVKAGMLPELSKRLPAEKDACVLHLPALGTYGGSAALASVDISRDAGELFSESLFRLSEEGYVTPNVASGYAVNDAKTEYTIYLREGMHWSDGTLFTSEDCIFFYEKLYLKGLIKEPLYTCFQVQDSLGKKTNASFTKVDKNTFKITFPISNPNFLQELLTNGGICFVPRHYFVNILPEFMSEKSAEAKVKDMGYASLSEFLKLAVNHPAEVYGLPTISPFLSVTKETDQQSVGSSITYERNPYYWKTDAEGRQLPYLDSITFTKLSDEEQGVFLTTEGYLSVHRIPAASRAAAEESSEKGKYSLYPYNTQLIFAVADNLKNFPTQNITKDFTVRGLGATEAGGWFLKSE